MKLENNYLEIELLQDRYAGQRFDNTGFITGVWLKESGLKKDGSCSRKMCHLGNAHVISFEIFISMELEPGETAA